LGILSIIDSFVRITYIGKEHFSMEKLRREGHQGSSHRKEVDENIERVHDYKSGRNLA
jgi:hypothetical protein